MSHRREDGVRSAETPLTQAELEDRRGDALRGVPPDAVRETVIVE